VFRPARRKIDLPGDRPLVLAHRGASADAPENTLPAFREAVAQGADGVELDTMVCGSGEVVVCHDEHLGRLAGQNLAIASTPYDRLREIDVGRRFGERFKGVHIPLLTEVLAELPDGFWVNVELKCDSVGDLGLARKVAAQVEPCLARLRIVISSFNPLELLRMRFALPSIPMGLLFERDSALWLRHGTLAPVVANASIHPEHTQCTPGSMERWRRAGYAVFTWTVDERDEIARLCHLGVAAIITNRPRAAREAVTALSSRDRSSHPGSTYSGSAPPSR
jgi:glycerophosphoryl diester phosphodiesterase